MSRSITLALLASSLWIGGCGNNGKSHRITPSGSPRPVTVSKTHSGGFPIKAVCTTGMVADLVRNIGGDHVTVEQLLGPDVDPHVYRLNTSDINKLNHAQIIFYGGLHLEGKMGELLERLGRKIPTFAVAEYLDPKDMLWEEETADPHVWFDVDLWRQCAGIVRDILVLYDPAHAADYRANGEKYQAVLADLHREAKERIAAIPKERRVLITSHDAFRYFGKAYGIEVKGVQGISTEAEASVKDVEKLVTMIYERKIPSVFVETSVNEGNIKAIIEGCQARGHKVVKGGKLFSDAMGPPGTPEETYVGMVRKNVEVIVNALK